MGSQMDTYQEKIRATLDRLLEENPEHSQSFLGRATVLTIKPFFTSPEMYKQLMEAMKGRLLECGWKDEVKLECNNVILRRGVDNVSVEEVAREVTPIARAKVPHEVKKEIVALLKNALMKELENSDLMP